MSKKQSLGLEKKIKNMDPKLNKLLTNILTIGIIFSLVYGVATFIETFLRTSSFMKFFSSSHFVTVTVMLVFCGLAYKLLQGGEFHIPDEHKKKGQKQQFNMPNVWGVQTMNKNKSKNKLKPENVSKKPKLKTRKNKPKAQGAWKCPKCNEFTVGNQCRSCGYKK